MTKKQPYIGISGFMSPEEVEACCAFLPTATERQRRLMIGVLASSKTVNGIPNNYPKKYPKREHWGQIFSKKPETINALHFHCESQDQSDRTYGELMRALEYCQNMVEIFQLNMVWPESKVVHRVKSQYQWIKFLLQINLRMHGYSSMPQHQLATNLRRYNGLIDYFLIDYSGGIGCQLKPELLLEYLTEIKNQNPQAQLAIAGGLKAENLRPLLEKIVSAYPDISIDAESGLRDNSEGGGQIDLEKARDYLTEAFSVLEPRT